MSAHKSVEQLMQENQGLVRSLASRIHRKLPPHLELEDLIAYGQVGLAEAAKDFNPSRGSRFSTYAYYRIRGAIYDGVSKMTWLSRAQYKRVRYEQMANETLHVENEGMDTAPSRGTDAEVRWLRDVSRALAVVYLATQGDFDEEGKGIQIADASTPDPQAALISQETTKKLHELIESLPAQAKSLIRYTYFEGLTLQEAGDRLGISKSWASRVHARTLEQLARGLRAADSS